MRSNVPSGRSKLAFVSSCIKYSTLEVLDRIVEKTGKSKSAVIRILVEDGIENLAKREKVRLSRAGLDRTAYLLKRYGI